MMQRRTVLGIAAATAVSSLLPEMSLLAARAATEGPPLPNPQMAGPLEPAQIETLYAIASHIGTRWQIAAGSAWSQSTFGTIVTAKSAAEPSYLTAYAMTVGAARELTAALGRDAAMDHLYLADPAWRPADWDVVRHWAIREFLVLYVTMGAFAAYGWHNFPGFVGGPCDDPSALPYRSSPLG